jgi:hypothetical protein
MEWSAGVNDELDSVARPKLNVAVPIVVAPSRKVTVPVGVPVPGNTALTVTVKITTCPKTAGFTDELTAVELENLFTVWVSTFEMLLLKFESPAYEAVIVWFPTVRAEVTKAALPELSVRDPKVVDPSRKVTIPVGVRRDPTAVTVAVNVTVILKNEGLTDVVRVVELDDLFTVWVIAGEVLLPKLASPL